MATANYVLLRRITVTDPVSSITFSSIPQTGYTDLKIVVSTRSTATDTPVAVQFNSVTTGYSWKRIYGSGSAASSQSGSDNYFMYQETSSQTANTFGLGELYIPNYAGSQAKSCSFDSLNENNATAADMFMLAGLNTMTAAINSITFTPYSGSFVAGSSFSLYGIANAATTPLTSPKADGGDIIKTDGTYWYHAFLSTGSFKPQVNLTADVLVIAGGGGGAGQNTAAGGSGGGGAGGLLGFTSQALASTSTYTCTVGAGGAGGGPSANGSTGQDSQFAALTLVKGGGYGAKGGSGSAGGNGGSGGGGAYGGTAGGTATSGQGNNGAAGTTYQWSGGGGGAGAAGSAQTPGVGVSTYSSWGSATSLGQNVSSTYYFAGGGAGGGGNASVTGANGGGGASGTSGTATSGTPATGGGGGGGGDSYYYGNTTGGNGGSGVIIIKYPV